jgi:hypothetical protein
VILAWRCAVLKDREVVSHLFPVALARGKHLFPFRTEQLSPSAPMVLGPQGPGRVGRRRFFLTSRPPGRLVCVRNRLHALPSAGSVRIAARGSSCPRRSSGPAEAVRCGSSGPLLFAPRRRVPWGTRWGTDTPRAPGPAGLDVAVYVARAAPRGALGPRQAPRRLTGVPPGRPPSRLDRRPRAGGTHRRVRALRERAARVSMFGLNRTCVRRVGAPADGSTRTYVRPPSAIANLAQRGQIPGI